jgi:hypothetical protein
LPVNAEGFYKTFIWRVALQTAPLNVFLYTPRDSFFARLASLAFLNSQ